MTQAEALTVSYENIRHSTNSDELHELARRELPDRANASAFSRATALLEAVAGNQNTPLDDRVFLAQTMPFPNILVKLSEDSNAEVRKAVASNPDVKDWLVGRLTKDDDSSVRAAALLNKNTSWKMRMEGAQDERTTPETLEYLGSLGLEENSKAPVVLAAMVRRSVALNPNVSTELLQRLAQDTSSDVANAACRILDART